MSLKSKDLVGRGSKESSRGIEARDEVLAPAVCPRTGGLQALSRILLPISSIPTRLNLSRKWMGQSILSAVMRIIT